MAVEKSPTRLEGARQHGLLRCQPGCAKSLEQSLSTCKPKCVPYTPLPTDSLGSLYIHCQWPCKGHQAQQFPQGGWIESAAGCQGHGKPLWFWHAWDDSLQWGKSLRRVFTALLTEVFGFLAACSLQEPQQHMALSSPTSQAELLSQPPRYPLSWNWAGTATSNLCLGQQKSTGSDFCKDNHRNSLAWDRCTFSFQYWVKEKRQVSMWA